MVMERDDLPYTTSSAYQVVLPQEDKQEEREILQESVVLKQLKSYFEQLIADCEKLSTLDIENKNFDIQQQVAMKKELIKQYKVVLNALNQYLNQAERNEQWIA